MFLVEMQEWYSSKKILFASKIGKEEEEEEEEIWVNRKTPASILNTYL